MKEDGFASHQNPRENAITIEDGNNCSAASAAVSVGSSVRPGVSDSVDVDDDLVELTRDEFEAHHDVIDLTI